ncbi:hypothetical protein SRHO_G00012070 [Serrasalmus rhombeus]
MTEHTGLSGSCCISPSLSSFYPPISLTHTLRAVCSVGTLGSRVDPGLFRWCIRIQGIHFIFLNTNRDRNICLSRPGLTEVSAGFYMFMTALTASLRLKLDCSAKNSST